MLESVPEKILCKAFDKKKHYQKENKDGKKVISKQSEQDNAKIGEDVQNIPLKLQIAEVLKQEKTQQTTTACKKHSCMKKIGDK